MQGKLELDGIIKSLRRESNLLLSPIFWFRGTMWTKGVLHPVDSVDKSCG